MGSYVNARIIRMRYHFCVPWNWKENSLVCLVQHASSRNSFLSVSLCSKVSPDDLNEIERYVVLLYQRTSALSHVNEARKQLFAQNRKMENIPPTLHALEQHVKRAVYQAGHIWGQSLIGEPEGLHKTMQVCKF